jgi:hypothetical protein
LQALFEHLAKLWLRMLRKLGPLFDQIAKHPALRYLALGGRIHQQTLNMNEL